MTRRAPIADSVTQAAPGAASTEIPADQIADDTNVDDQSELARQALALLAVDPSGLGGVVLASRASPGRNAWVDALRTALEPTATVRRVPVHVTNDRLCGGLDLAATLASGRPVFAAGLLSEADRGAIILASAERSAQLTVSAITAAIDSHSSCFATIALDESIRPDDVSDRSDSDEQLASSLTDRLAFRLDATALDVVPAGFVLGLEDFGDTHRNGPGFDREDDPGAIQLFDAPDPDDLTQARARLMTVTVPDRLIAGLTATAAALGIASIRSSLLAVKAARASAALAGRQEASDDDARLAAALVLAHRATRLPADQPSEDDAPPDQPPEPPDQSADEKPDDDRNQNPSEDATPPPDLLIEAAKAAIPAGLLAQLQSGLVASRTQTDAARSGGARTSLRRGRPAGSRPGDPRHGGRLDLVATLRRAAPWQAIRRAERATVKPRTLGTKRPRSKPGPVSPEICLARIEVRRTDLVIRRYEEKTGSLLIFAVDASGSAALARLAEAKGAVELLLAECYARRDEVAVIAFRGSVAELLLPPTRALARAKRALAELPGGGATPLAAALDAARSIATGARRKGRQPAVVLLTDGRANVARDGSTGRTLGEADALAAAAQLRASGVPALVIDTSDRPQPQAGQLASALGARFLALPRADATKLSAAVRAGLPGA
ncbi:MAG: magnesium chelatase subunit D [Hyphomicrobiaceae bacterium]|nr:magnesium chelatase subunit D [Hyphomicrobiaceae bacterium]